MSKECVEMSQTYIVPFSSLNWLMNVYVPLENLSLVWRRPINSSLRDTYLDHARCGWDFHFSDHLRWTTWHDLHTCYFHDWRLDLFLPLWSVAVRILKPNLPLATPTLWHRATCEGFIKSSHWTRFFFSRAMWIRNLSTKKSSMQIIIQIHVWYISGEC